VPKYKIMLPAKSANELRDNLSELALAFTFG